MKRTVLLVSASFVLGCMAMLAAARLRFVNDVVPNAHPDLQRSTDDVRDMPSDRAVETAQDYSINRLIVASRNEPTAIMGTRSTSSPAPANELKMDDPKDAHLAEDSVAAQPAFRPSNQTRQPEKPNTTDQKPIESEAARLENRPRAVADPDLAEKTFFGASPTPPALDVPATKVPIHIQGMDLIVSETDDGLAGFSFEKGTWDRIKIASDSDVSLISRTTVGFGVAVVVTKNTIGAFDAVTGKWAKLDLPDNDGLPLKRTVGRNCAVAYNDRVIYGYVAGAGRWATLNIPDDDPIKSAPTVGMGYVHARINGKLFVISKNSTNWTSPDSFSDSSTTTAEAYDRRNKPNDARPGRNRVRGTLERSTGVIDPNLAEIEERETKAARTADMMRQGDLEKPQQYQTTRNAQLSRDVLQQKLTDELLKAFDAKLQFEEEQIQQLKMRVIRLEQQIAERRKLRETIVRRKSQELLDGTSAPRVDDPSVPGVGPGSFKSGELPIPAPPANQPQSEKHASETSVDPNVIKSIRDRFQTGMKAFTAGEATAEQIVRALILLTEVDPSPATLEHWEALSKVVTKLKDTGNISKFDVEAFDTEYALARERIAARMNQPTTKDTTDSAKSPPIISAISDADIESALDRCRSRLKPLLEQLQASLEEVRSLEPGFLRDQSKGEEVKQALARLFQARQAIRQADKKTLEDSERVRVGLSEEFEAAAKIKESLTEQSQRTQQLALAGSSSDNDVKAAMIAVARAQSLLQYRIDRQSKFQQECNSLLPPDAKNSIHPGNLQPLSEPPTDEADDELDRFVVPYWFEASQGLKVEFVTLEKLGLPYKAALRILEDHDAFKAGDLIIAIGSKSRRFDSLAHVKRIFSELPTRDMMIENGFRYTTIRGGLTGEISYLMPRNSKHYDDGTYIAAKPQQADWMFEVHSPIQNDAAPAVTYINGACVSIDGLIAIPADGNPPPENIKIVAFRPEKATAKPVYYDARLGVTLLKIAGVNRRLFHWADCRTTEATLDQHLRINVSTADDVQFLKSKCTANHLNKPSLKGFAVYPPEFGVQNITSLRLTPGWSIFTVDDGFQGIVRNKDYNAEMLGFECIEARSLKEAVDAYHALPNK